MSLTYFKHLVTGVSATKAVVLLHGTGGNEHDLLPFVEFMQSQCRIVSLRGNVLEQGMPRFFKRFEMGVFDQENIRQEAAKLKLFLEEFSQQQHIPINQFTYLGYSNGANMILALLFLYPEYVHSALLLHPMLPFQPDKVDLHGRNLAISYGMTDQMVPAQDSQRLVSVAQELGATVHEFSHQGGHTITPSEMVFVKEKLTAFIGLKSS